MAYKYFNKIEIYDASSVFANPFDSFENVLFTADLPNEIAFKACLFVLFFQTDLRIFFFVFEVRFFGTAIM